MAALGTKRLAWRAAEKEADECCTSVASKGHCVVYNADGVRFEVPLACLGTAVLAELLRMPQEEFGFEGGDGRITLPCDAAVMEMASVCFFQSMFLLYIHGQVASKHHHQQLQASHTKHYKPKPELSKLQPEKRKKDLTMISAKRIAQLAKKWQRMAALGRKHLASGAVMEVNDCCASVATKGHCVVYTIDGRRFEVPLAYLGKTVFEELLRISQEEFGFASDGRITLPCDAAVMEYAMCLLRRSASAEVEKAFLSTMGVPCHYASCMAPSVGVSQQVAV
ncbi:Auxin-responsive protein SAUR36 [Dichanthelium oligosanthes]|uniref:Auxin-responsive protein SAUR36 n=1 Tax=Dichanthelium oligosanthes TaxID=888268 RepID=A0A1E5UWY4_9POAL|nr:Auxin-responsive protein SAUR36 [Dichanthelium oligosanthes]